MLKDGFVERGSTIHEVLNVRCSHPKEPCDLV
jgi:hypothetical protein